MGRPHRDIQNRDEELTSETKRRTTGVIVAGALVGVLLASLAAIPSFRSNEPQAGSPTSSGDRRSREAWLLIASDLMDTVPAALLLGGPGSNPQLEAKLADAHLDRDLFRRTAIVIRGESSGVRDDVEQDSSRDEHPGHPCPRGVRDIQTGR